MDFVKNQYVELIKSKAIEIGFEDCGIAPVGELSADKEFLNQWLDKGYNAEMHYMNNYFEKRTNPSLLVDGAKSAIVLLSNYYPGKDKSGDGTYKIARYAYGKDYHYVLKEKLQELYNYIKSDIYPALEGRMFVDSAPVLERALAVKAGLGWIGKNANLIHPRLGSYVFISELIVNLELPFSNEVRGACGGCTRCMDACPTKAIVSDKIIDARKCISYLTIENRNEIPEEFSDTFNDWIYGCDICQEVCPWTWKSRPHQMPEFVPDYDFLSLSKEDWQSLAKTDYNKFFKKSAVQRAGYNGLMRNINFVAKK